MVRSHYASQMTFTVYVIKSENTGKIYIGQTSDYENRIQRHNGLLPVDKKSFTYKNIGPWKLIYKEEYSTREEAIKREKELKSYRGREFIKNLTQW